MQRIESLTPEQEARFPEFKDKWLKIGLCTDPIDFEQAKAAMCLTYEKVGLAPPKEFYYAESPKAAIELIQTLSDNKLSPGEIFDEMIFGCHEAGWLSYYDFFKEVCNLEVCSKLDGLFALAKTAGWCNVYEDIAVIQDRPSQIRFDDSGTLHCENGPAIGFRDGFGLYAWHGVRIDREWIENPDTALSPSIALTWPNLEQRRVACEIMGWARILEELDAKVIDTNKDPQIGVLLEATIPEIGRERFLKVVCGTGRTFALPVPPNMKTALEANAWTYGLSPEEYAPEVRT